MEPLVSTLFGPMSSFPSRRVPSQPSGDPTVATFLTWFVPGAGHLYIGRAGFGLLAFVIVEGLFLLGLRLSDGMGFEFLQEELRGLLAPALAPELGNLGGLIYQIRSFGFGPGFPRPYPDTVILGSMLTAVSGVLNICLMCHVHFEARLSKGVSSGMKSPALPVLLTWLVPGLGHIFQGRRLRGVLIFVCLVGLLILGSMLADSSNLSRERHYYYWGGQLMGGLPAIGLQWLWGSKQVTQAIPYAEAGLVIASVAGLLNILVMLDVFGWSERAWFGEDEASPSEGDGEATSPKSVEASA
jgi:hypothetical protein